MREYTRAKRIRGINGANSQCVYLTFIAIAIVAVLATPWRSLPTASLTASLSVALSAGQTFQGVRWSARPRSATCRVFRACRDPARAHRGAKQRVSRWTDENRMVHGPPARSRFRAGVPTVG